MSDPWDLVIEGADRARVALAAGMQRVRQSMSAGFAIASGLLLFFLLYYIVWAFFDQSVACRTANECRTMLHADRVMQEQLDRTCALRKQDCAAWFFVRGPTTLFYDVYSPVYNTAQSMIWHIAWNYGFSIVGLAFIALVVIVIIATADRVVTPVFTCVMAVFRRHASQATHARIE